MERRVETIEGEIRGVMVRWDQVLVAGHLVEMTLSYRVADAERVYGKPWDEELDRHLQMGMFAMDRISADGTMGKAAQAEPRVVEGVCRRTTRIGNCEEAAPMSHYWTTIKPDGSRIESEPFSCVPGTPPIDHSTLAYDERSDRDTGNTEEGG